MQTKSVNYLTPDEYLEMERTSSGSKSEYYNGNILEMPGASEGHNLIVVNLVRELGILLKHTDFRIYPSDMRVASPGMDSYVYPDASIVSGQPVLEDDQFDTLLNPSVVIEVMSTYSKKRDLGYKFFRYQRIPSLKEYLVIDANACFIQKATRQKDETWRIEKIKNDMEASLFIETIACSLKLKDIYYRVNF